MNFMRTFILALLLNMSLLSVCLARGGHSDGGPIFAILFTGFVVAVLIYGRKSARLALLPFALMLALPIAGAKLLEDISPTIGLFFGLALVWPCSSLIEKMFKD